MKVAISYPPLPSEKGVPLLAQNRQFQWFKDPTYIYPVIPAFAATMLKESGFEVFWDDGIAAEISYREWKERICKAAPDVIVLESKTPVIRRHWKIIEELKRYMEGTKIVLVGDHVTALPQESMAHSSVDYVLTGGDYDFLLVSLCRMLDSAKQNSQQLEPGIWYRENGSVRNTGSFVSNHDLTRLPFIDRDLTEWKRYAFKNGNFRKRPGAYVMAGRDCWWGQCTFCSWTTLYPGKTFRTVSPERHLDEIGRLVDGLGVKEIFDDTGCFPTGNWLEAFCRGMVERGYHKRVTLGCNTRIGAQTSEQFEFMKKANFRFLLIGLESVNQATLNRLRKGIRTGDIEQTCRMAKNAGMAPHLTTMVGYPWETKEDAEATVHFAARLLRRGIIDSLQATIVVPYPGTPLFREAKHKGWLSTQDWDAYDMTQTVLKGSLTHDSVLRLTRDFYKTALHPGFLVRKVFSIRNIDDLEFMIRAGWKVIHHIADFRNKKNCRTIT